MSGKFVPFNEMSPEERTEIARKGAHASNKVRRQKKNIKELVKIALDTPLSDKEKKKFIEKGVPLNNAEFNEAFGMVMGQIISAKNFGNTKAFETLIKLSEDDQDKDIEYELPARLLTSDFIDCYHEIHRGKYNEFVFKGGRGSIKSTFVSEVILELLKKNPKIHWLVIRKFGNTLRDSCYAQFCWAISEMGLDSEWKCTTSPLRIVHKKTGQEIYFRGLDDPAKIKSIKPKFGYIGGVWYEEYDQIPSEEEVRSVIQSALRGGELGYIFKSFNPPKTSSNRANKEILIPKSNRYVSHSTYLSVPKEWLGQVFIDEAEHLKETNPIAYNHEYLGEVVGSGGQMFDNLEIREITDDEIKTFDRLYYGQDWGWFPDPNAFIGTHFDANRRILYLFEEFTGNKIANEDWAKKIEHHKDEIITADSAENKSIADFKSYGFDMRGAIKGPGSVDYSMKWLQSLCKIVIDPRRCPLATQEFSEYEYERDKEGNIITGYPDEDNHTIDATRYALERIWKRKGR